jgi:hypothetical protein
MFVLMHIINLHCVRETMTKLHATNHHACAIAWLSSCSAAVLFLATSGGVGGIQEVLPACISCPDEAVSRAAAQVALAAVAHFTARAPTLRDVAPYGSANRVADLMVAAAGKLPQSYCFTEEQMWGSEPLGLGLCMPSGGSSEHA